VTEQGFRVDIRNDGEEVADRFGMSVIA
jgi:hypothetical protein